MADSVTSSSISSCPGAVGGMPSLNSLPTSDRCKNEGNDDFRWARFFRELAGILVLYLNIPGQAWMKLLKDAGASRVDIDDVTSQDMDPEIQVYKLLNKSKGTHQTTNEWWISFLNEVTKINNRNFTKDVQRAYEKFITGETVDSLNSLPKSLPENKECPPMSPATPPPCVPKNSQSFEVIDEEEVIKSSEEIKLKLKEEINIEISDPEVSQQIDNVRRTIQDIAGKTQQHQISLQLATAVSQILEMENSFRAVQTLNNILEQENDFNKKERTRLIKENEAQSQEIQGLKQEIEELKKTSADKNLKDFDVITKREAHDLAEAKVIAPMATAAVTVEETNVVNINAYHDLQARCIKVTKQRDQLVKINHQWDKEYHNMEKALRSDNQKLYQERIHKDEEIMAGKRLVASLEKEKAEVVTQMTKTTQELDQMQRKYENDKGKCKKYHEYATRLSAQKEQLEQEISRLNKEINIQKVLSQEKRKGERKGPAGPGSEDYEEEIMLYRQQAEIFEKDFHEEQRERRRVMGELEASREELHAVKRNLRQAAEKDQLARDEQMAKLLQAGGNVENFYHRNDRQDPTPRGLNYAGNDRYVDAGLISSFGSIEADGAGSPTEKDANQCPRCQAYIENDVTFFQHLDRCLADEEK